MHVCMCLSLSHQLKVKETKSPLNEGSLCCFMLQAFYLSLFTDWLVFPAHPKQLCADPSEGKQMYPHEESGSRRQKVIMEVVPFDLFLSRLAPGAIRREQRSRRLGWRNVLTPTARLLTALSCVSGINLLSWIWMCEKQQLKRKINISIVRVEIPSLQSGWYRS